MPIKTYCTSIHDTPVHVFAIGSSSVLLRLAHVTKVSLPLCLIGIGRWHRTCDWQCEEEVSGSNSVGTVLLMIVAMMVIGWLKSWRCGGYKRCHVSWCSSVGGVQWLGRWSNFFVVVWFWSVSENKSSNNSPSNIGECLDICEIFTEQSIDYEEKVGEMGGNIFAEATDTTTIWKKHSISYPQQIL